MLDDVEAPEEALRAPGAADELDPQHAAEAVEERACHFVVRVIFEPRVMHVPYVLAAVAPLRDSPRVLVLSRDADVERLEAAFEKPASEGVGRLSPYHHLLAHLLDVRCGA